MNPNTSMPQRRGLPRSAAALSGALCAGMPTAMSLMAVCLTAATLVGCDRMPSVMPVPSTASTSAPPASGAHVTDLEVTEHVKMAMQQNDRLKGYDIAVVTLKGDVRLTGVIDTQADIDEATRIARTAEGVHTLHDELTLKR